MTRSFLQRPLHPFAYMLAAPVLVASQHAAVAISYRIAGQALVPDAAFWLLPLRRAADMPGLTSVQAALVFAWAFVAAAALAMLSLRRAVWSRRGYELAACAIVPAVQLVVVPLLAVLPRRRDLPDENAKPEGGTTRDIVAGVLAGIALIVLAVLISAISFGAYGWGLFVATPFMVGATTGYIVNRRGVRDIGDTLACVVLAGMLGGAALIMMALEGLLCIILIVPLAAIMAMLGGLFGRALSLMAHGREGTFRAVALLPALFALEAAMPPALPIETRESIDVAASPDAVWRALIASDPIAVAPGFTAHAGLAYPVRGRLLGEGVGAIRLGEFSTGTARERVTEWQPGRRLAFTVLSQPPAMEEMSPYRKVHAPHVSGYFVTGETRFTLRRLANGRTRVTIDAAHELRIDPVLYWEPLARWAIRSNVRRVLDDVRLRAESGVFPALIEQLKPFP